VNATDKPMGTGRGPISSGPAPRRRSVTVASPRGIVCGSAAAKNAAAPSSATGVTVPGVPTTVTVSGPIKPESNPAIAMAIAPASASATRFPFAPAFPRQLRNACTNITPIAIATIVSYVTIYKTAEGSSATLPWLIQRLSPVLRAEFLDSLTREIGSNYENLVEGDFMLNEFVDRFGPRMAHLNGLLQVLSQLGATPNPASTPNAT